MLWTKCSGRGLCQRCERWWGSRSCFLLTRCQNRCVSLIQVVVGYMSSIWYRQIRHSGDAKSTCGIAVNALLISILIFKCRWILFLQEMATGIVLEADALSLPAGQMYTCICHTLDTHFPLLTTIAGPTIVGSGIICEIQSSSPFIFGLSVLTAIQQAGATVLVLSGIQIMVLLEQDWDHLFSYNRLPNSNLVVKGS